MENYPLMTTDAQEMFDALSQQRSEWTDKYPQSVPDLMRRLASTLSCHRDPRPELGFYQIEYDDVANAAIVIGVFVA
jgi:hypothetical protein